MKQRRISSASASMAHSALAEQAWTNELLRTINRVQTEFIRSPDPRRSFDLLLQALLALTKSDFGWFGELHSDEGGNSKLSFHNACARPRKPNKPARHPDPAPTVCLGDLPREAPIYQLVKSRKILICNDRRRDPMGVYTTEDGLRLTAFLGMPLVSGDEVVGFVGLANDRGDYSVELTKRLEPFLRTAANLIAARRVHELRLQAEHAFFAGEQLRSAILETAVDGIISGDQNGRIIEYNRAAEKILGWRRDEALGRGVADTLIPAGRRKSYLEKSSAVHAATKSVFKGRQFETMAQHKDGRLIPVELTITATEIHGEKVFTSFLRDISAKKKSEKELNKALADAQAANVAKRKFVAYMSHEIRTPLNAILGGVELLTETGLTDAADEIVRVLSDSASALLTLVNDVLDFSQIEAKKVKIRPAETSVADLLDSVVRVNAGRAHANKVSIGNIIDPSVPARIITDPDRVQQILINLVANAINYSPGGHVSIRVVRDAHSLLRFEVRDNGVGIPADAQSEIFDGFFRVEGPASSTAGAGLGLAICKRMVTLLDGCIDFRSKPGDGSVFWFTIPMGPADSQVYRPRASGVFHGLKVGIVGPDDGCRADLVDQMTRWGIDTACFSTYAMLRASDRNSEIADRYDMVICDVEAMPRADQCEISATLKRGTAKLVWFMSTPKCGMAFQEAETTGDFLLRGPILQADLVACLNTSVGRLPADRDLGSGAAAATPELSGLIGKRVLLAEDSESNRVVSSAMLCKKGMIVETVEDGLAAFSAVEASDHDLILMDLDLPGIDGLEATRRIRALDGPKSAVPIVAMTAHALQGIEAQCLEAGMNDCLSKPVDSDIMFSKLHDLLTKSGDHAGIRLENPEIVAR